MYQGSFAPQSNRGRWIELISVLDDDTDDPIDLSDTTIIFEVRDRHNCRVVLSATIANGKITLPDLGVFQVAFTADDMKTLYPGTYDVGCTISNDDSEPQQFIIGSVPILDGIVSR